MLLLSSRYFPVKFYTYTLDRFRGRIQPIFDTLCRLSSRSSDIGSDLNAIWTLAFRDTSFIMFRNCRRYLIRYFSWLIVLRSGYYWLVGYLNRFGLWQAMGSSLGPDQTLDLEITLNGPWYENYLGADSKIFSRLYEFSPRSSYTVTSMQPLQSAILGDRLELPSRALFPSPQIVDCTIVVDQNCDFTSKCASFSLTSGRDLALMLPDSLITSVDDPNDFKGKRSSGRAWHLKAQRDNAHSQGPFRNLFILSCQAEQDVDDGLVMCTRNTLKTPNDWSCRSSSSSASL